MSKHTQEERPHYHRYLLVVIVFALAAAIAADRVFFQSPWVELSDRRSLMDTWVTVTVYSQDVGKAKQAIESAFSRMEEVVHATSNFDPNAEASRLNEEGKLVDPSSDLWTVISAAQRYARLSRGAFDITVEPLLELWKNPDADGKHLWEVDPATRDARIAAALVHVGPDKLTLTQTGSHRIISLAPGAKITLGGIAKGYAVDQGLAALRTAGIAHAMINAGGDIGVYGGKPDGSGWEIALRNPQRAEDMLARFVISAGAVATSGNYERYFDPAAEVGHIMDPHTGYSAHRSSSATVIAPTCMEADALATATFVLGPKDGIALLDSLPEAEGLIIGYDNPRELHRTAGLEKYMEAKD